MKSLIAMLILSWSLTAHSNENYQDGIFRFYGVSGINYESGDQLKDQYDKNLAKRFGEVNRIEISEHLESRPDLRTQLQAIRRGMRINEEIIIRIKRDPGQVIAVRIEDHQALVDHASSLVGMAINTVGRIMYLGMPQSTSEVIDEAEEMIERLHNNEVHVIYIFSDYKLKASIDSKGREAFIYNGKVRSLDQLARSFSESHYYYGGVTNIFKASKVVDSRVIELFSLQK